MTFQLTPFFSPHITHSLVSLFEQNIDHTVINMAQDKVSDALKLIIEEADPFRRQGTAYLHTRDDRNRDDAREENPTGAVVVPISVATTFEQRDPGVATAKDDPNSFGMGYEYSRTGT